jgi:hypothetical protein
VAVVVAVMILLAALGVCFLPLLLEQGAQAGGGSMEPTPRQRLEAERRRLLDAIHDVDLDLAMGKVAEGDHSALRASLEAEAVAVLRRLEDLDAPVQEPAEGSARGGLARDEA